MEATLKSLREYQETLIRISDLDNLLAYVPPEIEDLEKEWLAIKDRITELTAKKEELGEQIKEKENSLAEAVIKSQKFEKDLHEVTNNKEYHAVLKEIDMVKKQIHGFNEGVSQRKTELQEIERNLEECVELEKESKNKYDSEKARYEEQQSEHYEERKKGIKKKDQLAKKIPKPLMKQFDRIAIRRNGIGLALCAAAVCQACNVRIRQNIVDQLRKHDRIIACESCKRILYFIDPDTA